MKKVILMPFLLGAGCFLAGVYGVLHNQISYSVSPDYFHEFKYVQFRLDPAVPGRAGASMVGWQASWWMGIIIGLFLVPIGLIVPGTKNYALAVLRSYAVVVLTALVVGLTALMIACWVVTAESAEPVVRYGRQISNPVEFRRAGTMHNFSYLGGLLGIITGIVWLLVERRRVKRRGVPEEKPDTSGAA